MTELDENMIGSNDMNYDCLVVGAGYSGCVAAERLAAAGRRVLIIEKRSHIGGNAFDELDDNGVLVHRYGPHIFHTNSKNVFEYLSKFTSWRPYEHKVLSFVEGSLYPFPINRDTINKLYDYDLLSEQQVEEYLESVREKKSRILSSEDVVLNAVGRDLYEKFFKGYSIKQWGIDPSKLKAGVAARIPFRTNQDDRYFTDTYQVMPEFGYHAMFSKMLNNTNISVRLGVDFQDIKHEITAQYLIYTGKLDEYFDFCFGPLPYRSLEFEHSHIPEIEHYQQVGTVNYPNDHKFTRITEFKHLTGQQVNGTSIVREYPKAIGDPYYPVLTEENMKLLSKYKKLASKESNVFFVGRLAQYRYYNMDQAVAASLKTADNILKVS